MTYTESKAIQGIGAVLAIGAIVGSSAAFVPVFEVTDSSFKGAAWDKNEVTNLSSPNKTKEYRKGALDPGSVTVKGSMVSSDPGQIAMAAAHADSTNPYQFTLTMPLAPGQASQGDVYTFSALVMSWTSLASVSPSKTVEFEGELQITAGKPALTPGS